jgi:integrase
VLLLTGARREELASVKWDDVSFQWRSIAMKDKIKGERDVPLTPYVAHLLNALPRRNNWVFSSVPRVIAFDDANARRRAARHARGAAQQVSASGRLADPSQAHRRACAVAGVPYLTLHGLRRSFASLCEWVEIPAGIGAQIQGHAPQGVREQSYIRRSLDMLRMHHEKIEAWILNEAGIAFTVPKTERPPLGVVSAA